MCVVPSPMTSFVNLRINRFYVNKFYKAVARLEIEMVDTTEISGIKKAVLITTTFIGIMWSLGSVLSYFVVVLSDSAYFYILLVFGIFVGVVAISLSVGVLSIRATKHWGDEICASSHTSLKKSEILLVQTIALGMIMGIGVWDISFVVVTLVDNSWNIDVMFVDYLMLDLVYLQVYIPIWAFVLSGIGEIVIPIVVLIVMRRSISDGSFCEI